jgi:hypothetical protein
MSDPVDKLVVSDKKLRLIAEVAHNISEAYKAAIGEDLRGSFANQPEQYKFSVTVGVVNHLMNPKGVSSEESHNLWMTHKLKDGWRYGSKIDDQEKTHPNLLPYSQLPESQRVKDYLFLAVVESLRDL